MTVRPLFAALLSLVLVLAGQGMAFARTQAPAQGHMVLCTGHGAVMVYVDKDGQPTSAPQLCSDCVLVVVGDVPEPVWVGVFHVRETRLTPDPETHQKYGQFALCGSARAPPFHVI